MIRPDLRDLINRHKPIEELNNNNNNNNNTDTNNTDNNNTDNNNTDTSNDDNNNNNNNNNIKNYNNNTDHGEWKIQLLIIISCISTKRFNKKRTMHSKSKAAEVYIGSNIEDVIDTPLIHYYKIFRLHNKHQMKEEANLFPIVLKYYIMNFIK